MSLSLRFLCPIFVISLSIFLESAQGITFTPESLIQECREGSNGFKPSCLGLSGDNDREDCWLKGNCEALVAAIQSPDGQKIHFRAFANARGSDFNYVAVGVNKEGFMAGSSIVECVHLKEPQKDAIFTSFALAKDKPLRMQISPVLENKDIKMVKGYNLCEFDRLLKTTMLSVSPPNNEVDLNNNLHLVLSHGETTETGELTYHNGGRGASSNPMSLKGERLERSQNQFPSSNNIPPIISPNSNSNTNGGQGQGQGQDGLENRTGLADPSDKQGNWENSAMLQSATGVIILSGLVIFALVYF